MKFSWRPIHIEAKIEPDGIRVVGDNGGEVLPAWTLVPWTRVSTANLPHPIDENGRELKLNSCRVVFNFGYNWKRSVQSVQREIRLVRRQWFTNPEIQFELNTSSGGIRKIALRSVLFEFGYGVLAVAGGGWFLWNTRSMLNGKAQIGAFALGSVILLGGLILLWKVIRRMLNTQNDSWVVSMNERGAEVFNQVHTRNVPWSAITSVRLDSLLYTATINGTERAFIAPGGCTKAILESRVSIELPKLITLGFVFIGVLAALAGPIVLWSYQWLQLPLNGLPWQVLSLVCLMLWGMLFLHHFMARRELRKVNETNTPQIP